jgi:hypothetical protein
MSYRVEYTRSRAQIIWANKPYLAVLAVTSRFDCRVRSFQWPFATRGLRNGYLPTAR